jgi:hypothetical protein
MLAAAYAALDVAPRASAILGATAVTAYYHTDTHVTLTRTSPAAVCSQPPALASPTLFRAMHDACSGSASNIVSGTRQNATTAR